jgi:hypothetical protein
MRPTNLLRRSVMCLTVDPSTLRRHNPMAGANELDVSRSTYKEIHTGQTVQLKLKKDALGAQWYYLDDW